MNLINTLQTKNIKMTLSRSRRALIVAVVFLAATLIILFLSTVVEGRPTPDSAPCSSSTSLENVAKLLNGEKIPEKEIKSSFHEIPPSRWNPIQNR